MAARRASAQAEAAYHASVLQPAQPLGGLAALLLPALAAMHHAPQPAPPPQPPPEVLQSLEQLGADVLRACLSGLLQHALQAHAPPPPPSFDLARMLLSAQQLLPPQAPPGLFSAAPAWPHGPPPPPPHV